MLATLISLFLSSLQYRMKLTSLLKYRDKNHKIQKITNLEDKIPGAWNPVSLKTLYVSEILFIGSYICEFQIFRQEITNPKFFVHLIELIQTSESAPKLTLELRYPIP